MKWRKIRANQLRKAPLCEKCLDMRPRRLVVATVADHKTPWKTAREFYLGPFQSLCHYCHNDKTFFEDVPLRKKKEKTKMEAKDV